MRYKVNHRDNGKRFTLRRKSREFPRGTAGQVSSVVTKVGRVTALKRELPHVAGMAKKEKRKKKKKRKRRQGEGGRQGEGEEEEEEEEGPLGVEESLVVTWIQEGDHLQEL